MDIERRKEKEFVEKNGYRRREEISLSRGRDMEGEGSLWRGGDLERREEKEFVERRGYRKEG